jgi:hypothetical protein
VLKQNCAKRTCIKGNLPVWGGPKIPGIVKKKLFTIVIQV